MNFNKVKHQPIAAEFIGTFVLTLAILASVWGVIPLVPTAVIAGATLGLLVLSLGHVSGTHVNPAITVGLYSVKKIDAAHTVSYLIAQLGGALVAMLVLSMFLDTDLVTKLDVVADYRTFFAEFLGTMVFGFGVAAAVEQKFKSTDSALLVGGSLALGAIIASLGSSGLLNPAVAAGVGSFNWAYVLGPLLGGIIGMNLYALTVTKKGRM